MLSALIALTLVAGPVLIEGPAPPPPADAGPAAWLWLNALGADGRLHVAERLEGLATRLEARFHPLVHDFEDEPLEDDVRRFLRHHLPSLNAARALSSGAWAAPAGGTLRLADRCEGAGRCVSLTALTPHEAFRAWPIAHAIRLRSPYIPATALATHLRAWLPPSQYGLIITAGDLVPQPVPRVAAAAKRLHKRLKRLEPKYAEYLNELLTVAQPRPIALPIAADAVWVVPRLSGLGQLAALREVVHVAVATLAVEWRSPPWEPPPN